MRSERALRRAVAELAMVAPDDLDAILAGLDQRHREAVEALLASYRGEPASPPAPKPRPVNGGAIRIEGLSPWLALRLENRSQQGAARPGSSLEMSAMEVREAGLEFAMTTTAFEALRSAAGALEQQPGHLNGKAVVRERLWPGLARKNTQDRWVSS